MKKIYQILLKRLPKSLTEINKKNVMTMKAKVPVPNDYHILWADIRRYKNCPSATIIAKEALIIKFTKKEIKEYLGEKVKTFYRIIPWSEISMDEIDFVCEDNGQEKTYILKINGLFISQLSYEQTCKFVKGWSRRKNRIVFKELESAVKNDVFNFKVRNHMWDSLNLSSHWTNTGHGIYAEKAGVYADKLTLHRSSHTGSDNADHGPDKIKDGVRIQCKYYKTARGSVNAAFKNEKYSYFNADGKPMALEVPKNQKNKAVEIMKTKIRDGKVPGISDENEAYNLIYEGHFTYNQVRNMAKAGTIESLAYDAFTGTITAFSTAGISTLIEYSQCLWSEKSFKKAFNENYVDLAKTFCVNFAKDEFKSVIANQLVKTKIPVMLKPGMKKLVGMTPKKIKDALVNSGRIILHKKPIHGASANNALVKQLANGTVISLVSLGVEGTWDYIEYARKKISGSQIGRDMVDTVGGMSGFAAGAALGAKIPGGKKVKAAGAVIGGLAGGIGGSAAAKGITNLWSEDDSIVIKRMYECVALNYLNGNILTGVEIDEALKIIDEKFAKTRNITKEIHSTKAQAKYIEDMFKPVVDEILLNRYKITKSDVKILDDAYENTLKGELSNEM